MRRTRGKGWISSGSSNMPIQHAHGVGGCVFETAFLSDTVSPNKLSLLKKFEESGCLKNIE